MYVYPVDIRSQRTNTPLSTSLSQPRDIAESLSQHRATIHQI